MTGIRVLQLWIPCPDGMTADLIIWGIFALAGSIAIHELGHFVAGRMLGYRVLACGLGHGRRYLSLRLFGTTFYIAERFLTSGFTTYIPDRDRPDRLRTFVLVAGGPLANLFTVVGMMALWSSGNHSNGVVAFFYMSLLLLWLGFMPRALIGEQHVPERELPSDRDILSAILQGKEYADHRPRMSIRAHRHARESLRSTDCIDSTVQHTLAIALQYTAYGLPEFARRELEDAILKDPRRSDTLNGHEAFVFAAISVEENSAGAVDAIEAARMACAHDPTMLKYLEMMDIELAWRQGADRHECAERIKTLVDSVSDLSIRASSEYLLFLFDEPTDVAASYQKLIADHQRNLHPLAQLKLLSVTTKVLVQRGQISNARRFFVRASRLLNILAEDFDAPDECEAFLVKASEDLRKAIAANSTNRPPWVGIADNTDVLSEPESKINGPASLSREVVSALAMLVFLLLAINISLSFGGEESLTLPLVLGPYMVRVFCGLAMLYCAIEWIAGNIRGGIASLLIALFGLVLGIANALHPLMDRIRQMD